MFRFKREKILPLFLGEMTTVFDMAKRAGIHSRTLARAVNGEPVKSDSVEKIARALGIDPLDYLEPTYFEAVSFSSSRRRRAGGQGQHV